MFDNDILGQTRVLSLDRIASLWDMLRLDTGSFISSLTYLSGTISDFRNILKHQGAVYASLDMNGRAQILKAIQTIRETCQTHGLQASTYIAEDAQKRCMDLLAAKPHLPLHPNTLIGVSGAIESLLNSVIAEAKSRQFYTMGPNAASFSSSADEILGTAAVDAFPDAVFDIEEAGKALSFALNTAAVMHCMRALEACLRSLAAFVQVEHGENWNKTLNEIEVALRGIRRSEQGADAETWAAEAGTHLRFVKNAWRNQAMHPLRTFDERQAKQIYENTISFMQHLAERLNTA